MQLTNYTDYALRTLIAVALVAPDRITVGEISQAYGISTNHLLKVVQRLAALGYVETSLLLLRARRRSAALVLRQIRDAFDRKVRWLERVDPGAAGSEADQPHASKDLMLARLGHGSLQ